MLWPETWSGNIPSAPSLEPACSGIRRPNVSLQSDYRVWAIPACSLFLCLPILPRTQVPDCSSPALWKPHPSAAYSSEDCAGWELAVEQALLLNFLCVTMIRSPGFSSYLGAFKFSEKQGKAREIKNVLRCIFYIIMSALCPPFYPVFCIQIVIQLS